MATKAPGNRPASAALSDFRRVLGNPAFAALADADPNLYLALQQLVAASILVQADVNARVLKLEEAPGVEIPPYPELPDRREGIAQGYASLSGGTVTVSEAKCVPSTVIPIIVASYRGLSGTHGTLSVPAGGTADGSFTIESRDAAGAIEAADNSEVAWILVNPLP